MLASVRIEPADDALFRERDAWRYDPPYDFYDTDSLPVNNPELFFAVRDGDGALLGFYFFEPVDDRLFHGLGLRPDLTGRGLGEQFVLTGLQFARTVHGRSRCRSLQRTRHPPVPAPRFRRDRPAYRDIRRLRARGVHRHGKTQLTALRVELGRGRSPVGADGMDEQASLDGDVKRSLLSVTERVERAGWRAVSTAPGRVGRRGSAANGRPARVAAAPRGPRGSRCRGVR